MLQYEPLFCSEHNPFVRYAGKYGHIAFLDLPKYTAGIKMVGLDARSVVYEHGMIAYDTRASAMLAVFMSDCQEWMFMLKVSLTGGSRRRPIVARDSASPLRAVV